MKISKNKTNSFAILRQKAEDILKKNVSKSDLLVHADETLKLLHELQVYQVELEMQNDELIQNQSIALNAIDFYNYSQNGYFTLTINAEIIDLNQAGVVLLAREKHILIGSSFQLFITEEKIPIFKNFLQNVFQSKVNEICEIELLISDNLIYVQLTGSINKTRDRCFISIVDISEKKQSELKLQSERELYWDLVNNQPAGIYRIRLFSKEKWGNNAWENSKNPPYKMELASDRFCQIIGIAHSEFEANTAIISDLIHPQDKHEFTLKNEEANSKIISFEWEGRLIIHDKIKWVHLESFPRLVEDGDILWTGIIYDISDRKQAELALKESEERFQMLFNKAPLGYQSLDINGCFLEVNQQWLNLFGYQREEVLGRNFGEFMTPTYQELVKLKFPLFKAQGYIHSEFEMVHKKGSIHFIAFDGKIGYDSEGNFKQTHCILQDITEKRIFESKLKESEIHFRTLADSGQALIWTSGLDKKCNYFNEPWLRFTGQSLEHEIGDGWVEGVHPDDLQHCIDVYVSGFDRREKFSMEYRVLHFSGEYRWIQDDGTPRYDSNGVFLGFIGHCLDITERKLSEEKIKFLNNQYNLILNSAGEGIIGLDVNGKHTFYNQSAIDTLGYNRDEFFGAFGHDLWHHGRKLEDIFAIDNCVIHNTIKTGKIHRVNTEVFYRKDGSSFPVEYISSPIIEDEKITGAVITFKDITVLKEAEDALKKIQLVHTEMERVGKVGGWEFNIDTLKSLWTEETYRIHEVDYFLETTVDSGENYYTPTSRPIIEEAVNRAIIYGEPFDLELEIITAKGNLRNVHTIGQVDIENRRVYGFFQDISERKQLENIIKESELNFRSLFEKGPIGIAYHRMIYDETGKPIDYLFLEANAAYQELTGVNPLGMLVTEAFPGIENDPSDWIGTFGEVAKTGKEIRFQQYLQPNDRWYDCVSYQYKPDHFVAAFLEITDQKKAEEALRESEKKLNTLFGSMTEMVVIHELVLNEIGQAIDYKILDCNDTFTQITGIKKENAIGKLATEIYQTVQSPYLQEYTNVCITGNSLVYKTYYLPMDKHFLISAVSIGVNQFATITTDITSLEKTNEIITEKNKELENYIYVASHDLRSPLVNIQGFSQRLERQTAELKRIVLDNKVEKVTHLEIEKITNIEIPKSLNFILSNVVKMDTLINGLLQLSRTGRIQMNVVKIDMNSLINSILSAHNFELTEINALVQIKDLEDCYGDENHLNQLFSNIINNAVKYRDKNRQLRLEIASQSHFNRIIYSFKDSGMGINSRHLEKIWDVFYRVDSASPEAGEGIGLSLARRIVDKHEGKIWVESEEGKGSTFYIELHKTAQPL